MQDPRPGSGRDQGDGEAASTTVAAPRDRRGLDSYFTGAMPGTRRVSFLYRVGLAVVALVLLVLPLVYAGLIALVGWGVVWYAQSGLAIFDGPRGYFGSVLVYAGPLIAGVAVIFFMCKPIFARRVRSANPYALERHQEPLFHELVGRIAAAVGAPAPARIELIGVPNASASLRRGLLSFFGSDLTLTVGTPLIHDLDARQLAGVIAHELGHFAQGTGMRLTYLIRVVAAWFGRVVYGRDSWDVRLVVWSKRGGWIAIVFLLCRLCVFISRLVLWVLMCVAHAVACVALRQMEFDADRCQTAVAGSDAFATTNRRIHELAAAFEVLGTQLDELIAERRLPDDLPAVISETSRRLPAEMRQVLERDSREGRTGLFDTHPPTHRRLEAAKRMNAPGIFVLEAPARTLFRHFDVLCKWTTLGLYHAAIGPQITADALVPARKLVQRHDLAGAATQAEERYFLGLFGPVHQFFPAGRPDAPPDAPAARAALRETRDRLATGADEARRRVDELTTCDEHLVGAMVARALRRAGIKISPKDFHVDSSDVDALGRAIADASEKLDRCRLALEPFDTLMARRLGAALDLLHHEGTASEKLRRHADGLLEAMRAMQAAAPHIDQLRRTVAVLGALGKLASRAKDAKVDAVVQQVAADLHLELQRAFIQLRDAPHPLEHGGGELTLAGYAIGSVPPPGDLHAIFDCAGHTLGRLYPLLGQMLGRLAMLAERVEKAEGLKPLEAPAPAPPPRAPTSA